MSFEGKIVAASATRTRLLVIGAFVFAVAATMWGGWRMFADAYAAILYPGELDYGEGIVWEQMRLMLAGRGYGSIDALPAIVFHYPPIFHMMTAGLSAATGLDPLAAGRSVSTGATLVIGLFGGLIAARTVRADSAPRTALLCGLVACLTTFCFAQIGFWAPLMRVDMLSIAFSFAGFFVAMSALTRPRLIVVSALLFVAAVFTKQISIVAPAAVFLTFLLLRPRLAWGLAASCMVIGLVVLGALTMATDGGFVRHVFLYNVNRFEPWRLMWIPVAIAAHFLLFAVLIIGLSARLRASLPRYRGTRSLAELRQRLAAAPADALLLLVLVYASLASLVILSIAKSGSNQNYLVEWMAVLAILLGIVVRDAANAAFDGSAAVADKRLIAAPFLLPLLIGVQAIIGTPIVEYAKFSTPRRIAGMQTLHEMVSSAQRPVISDNMVVLVRAGVPVPMEPAIFAELASMGAWDERPFVKRIRDGHFAFFITNGRRGKPTFDLRYTPAVADAMDAAYPVKRVVAGYLVHLPADAAR